MRSSCGPPASNHTGEHSFIQRRRDRSIPGMESSSDGSYSAGSHVRWSGTILSSRKVGRMPKRERWRAVVQRFDFFPWLGGVGVTVLDVEVQPRVQVKLLAGMAYPSLCQ